MQNILITNASSHTLLSTVYSLRMGLECKIFTISKKIDPIAEYLSDKHFTLEKENYISKIIEICKKENINVLVPLSIKERIEFMENIDLFNNENIKIISSSAISIKNTENKLWFFKECEKLGIPTPKHFVVKTYTELKKRAEELGYPKKKVVIKPVISSGSRGLRILNKKIDYKILFYKTRAENVEIRLSNLKDILGEHFEELLVCEYLPGEEFTIDCLNVKNRFEAIPRTRIEIKHGLTHVGAMTKNKTLIDYSKKLAEELNLTTVFGFQFKEDKNGTLKAIDCNPRIQGTMIMSTLAGGNIIAASVLNAIGKDIPTFDIDWKMKFYRIQSGISIGKDKKIVAL